MRVVLTVVGLFVIVAYSLYGAWAMNDGALTAASGLSLSDTIDAMNAAGETYSPLPGIIFGAFGTLVGLLWAGVSLTPRITTPAQLSQGGWVVVFLMGAPAFFFASFSNMNSLGDTFFHWNQKASMAVELPIYLTSVLCVAGGIVSLIVLSRRHAQ